MRKIVLIISAITFCAVSAYAQTRVSTLANGTVAGCASHASYPPAQAFDGAAPTQAGRWLVEPKNFPAWIEYRFNQNFEATVSSYNIISGGDATHDKVGRFPKDWTLHGSDDDGATWSLVDAQSGVAWNSAGQKKSFTLPETSLFRAYRFSFTANNGATDYLSISEIELMGEKIEPPPPPPLEPVTSALIEAESFDNIGGWALDTMFVDIMGSVYLNAHGCGKPVADATTRARFAAGEYAVWVRTRDWTPDYDGADKPGRFKILVGDVALAPTFGIAPTDWGWVHGGTFVSDGEETTITLRDLTGFNGRVDAIYITDNVAEPSPPNDGAAIFRWRAQMRGKDETPETVEEYDLVVVGGGVAGCAAAVAAAQQGMSVALVQDRDVLGGNASGEIRLRTTGAARHAIVSALENTYANGLSGAHLRDEIRMSYVRSHANITLRAGWRAYWAETNSAGFVAWVDARDVRTGESRRFAAPLFVDATGDGWVGFWAGADFLMGREAKSDFNETEATLKRVSGKSLIPDVADGLCLGNSLMWSSSTGANDTTFPDVPWATKVSGNRSATSGDWRWETGLSPHENTIYDAEMLRDRLLRAIFGSFKNAHTANPKRYLSWVPYVSGKRESRRLLGDHVITQHDVQNAVWFEDAVGTASWPIDLHFYANENVPYLAECSQTTVGEWYFPYRALYSRNVGNLFMAGRDISCTHVAFGSLRVMNTCGQMGVAVGYAASLCKKYDCSPRDIYRDVSKTQELQLMIGGVWPERDAIPAPDIPDNAWTYADNSDPATEISGNWPASSHNTGQFHGADYLHNNKAESANLWVRYNPELPADGHYYIQGIWNGGGTDRHSAAAIEIITAAGAVTNLVDMNKNVGKWTTLGVFDLSAATAAVRVLTVGANGYTVIADAFRFAPSPVPPGESDPYDYDGNGLPDAWERLYFLKHGGVDPDADPDGDGFTNRAEYIAGTDPDRDSSFFSIKDFFVGGSAPAVNLHLNGASNRTYKVLWTDSLTNDFHEIRAFKTTSDGPHIETIEASAPAGFYKITVEE